VLLLGKQGTGKLQSEDASVIHAGATWIWQDCQLHPNLPVTGTVLAGQCSALPVAAVLLMFRRGSVCWL
jgi:hypothetical protein